MKRWINKLLGKTIKVNVYLCVGHSQFGPQGYIFTRTEELIPSNYCQSDRLKKIKEIWI